jgi:hypothetical protein
MSNNYDLMGVSETTINNVEVQTIKEGFKPLDSGVYKGNVTEFATFTSSGGAGMLKVTFTPSDANATPVTIYQNIKKKDGSDNEIGQATFRHVLDAAGKTLPELNVVNEEIEAYGKKVQGVVAKGMENIVVTAFIRNVFEEGAKFDKYNEVEAWGRADGTNSKGEDMVAKFKEKIEKAPVLIRKAKNTGGAAQSTAASAAAADIDSML